MRPLSNRTITIKKWNEYKFNLYVPERPDHNNKPSLSFYHLDTITGKLNRIRIYKGLSWTYTMKKLKENAKALVNEIVENLEAGHDPFSKGTIFPDKYLILTTKSSIQRCMEHWLAYRKETFESGALKKKGYLSSLNTCTFFKDWLEVKNLLAKPASSLTQFEIELFLQAYAKRRGWNKVSYNTYRGHLITLFNYLLALKAVSENPAILTRKQSLKNDSSRFRIYEEEELRQVVTALAADEKFYDLYVAAKLVYKFNIRPIELLRLQVKDIDWVKAVLVLPPEKTKNGNEARFALDDESVLFLRKLIKSDGANLYIFSKRGQKSSCQLCDGYFDQRWRAFRKQHELPAYLKFYALKHSSNYYDLQDGASFEEIRQRNRHSNLQVTTLYIKERLFKNSIQPTKSGRF
ncbi:tyrosine-type recombinase/integrase [Mucilaginibacter agri]|uniref:Tyrosine-type recombinase/integrase n=1 Tax=Mucilaginibacter agri TaxID=2695265 RepID=A0A966DS24_9SPHI|nr:site-specific integrase [Mucilaginibacter agri]NCD67886.1 tyrosine-type recombinase/integrase [Mucilaginibacter agri]